MTSIFTIFTPLIIWNVVNVCKAFRGNNYAVLRGSTIRIGCIPWGMQVEGEGEAGSRYAWTGRDGKEVIDARFTRLASGELEIANVHVADSGNYTCRFHPPSSWDSKYKVVKSFRHKLIVFEIAGHTLHSSINLNLSTQTAEASAAFLRDLLRTKVCKSDVCEPGTVQTKKCALLESGKQTCEFVMVYKGIQPDPDELCDEECVREVVITGLKKAEGRLKAALLVESENRRSQLHPDMDTFNTRRHVTCRAGFRLVKTHHRRCFPCFPGTSSKSNSLDCKKCAVGFFQANFGRHDCERCAEGKTTESVGAKSEEECVTTTAGVLTNIKDTFGSIFTG